MQRGVRAPGPRVCTGCSQHNRSCFSVNSHGETMGGSLLQIRSLTLIHQMQSLARKTQMQRGEGWRAVLMVTRIQPEAQPCGLWVVVSTHFHPSSGGLWVWGLRIQAAQVSGFQAARPPLSVHAGDTREPRPERHTVTTSLPGHPFQRCPHANGLPFRAWVHPRQHWPVGWTG